MTAWLVLAGWLALAEPPEERTVDEIVVYADYIVGKARQDVVRELEQAGYGVEIQRGNVVVFRHPDTWRGEVHVHDDGWVVIKRQPVQFRPRGAVSAAQAGPLSWVGCVWLPACFKPGGLLVSKRKFDAQRGRTYDSAYPEVRDWADRIADREVDERVDELPDQLEALWEEGEPLEGQGGTTFATMASRREALVEYWQSRTDNVWGDRVRIGVEAFMRAVVQHSDDPFTEQELARFNEHRTCERVLDLSSPWDQVIATVDVEPF